MPLAIPVAEACALLHCGRTRIFELLASGRLRRVRIGRKTLVGVESINALLAPPEPKRSPRRARSGFVPFTREELRLAEVPLGLPGALT